MSDRQSLAVLGMKPGHDGALALLEDEDLRFSFEAEKDNGLRYSEIGAQTFLKALQHCPRIPDVLAVGGWSDGDPTGAPVQAGYMGVQKGLLGHTQFAGTRITTFTSTHERSHVMCAYGMAPLPQGQPCYVLVWEGYIGAFYSVDENVTITKLADILPFPGIRYAFLFGLADPAFKLRPGGVRLSDAGKLMALTAFGEHGHLTGDAVALAHAILDPNLRLTDLNKDRFAGNPLHNCGVTDPNFTAFAKYFSDALFSHFEGQIKTLTKETRPLLIAGGCALNCEWNSRWKQSGLFSSVFVPPCANDSGSAIGTAIDARFAVTGQAKIDWSVYAGEAPLTDIPNVVGFRQEPYSPRAVASALERGNILGWVKGRYEIGPRALGARSILASPKFSSMLNRLNELKRREAYRPIAPVCLAEDAALYFSPSDPSPYMLEFREVISPDIPAVTHVDRSARPQTITAEQNPALYELLSEFRAQTGLSVLCNTSLNFNGAGFINRLSDLRRYALDFGLDGFVFEDSVYFKCT